MTANELLDFLFQENIGLYIDGSSTIQIPDYEAGRHFYWYRGSHTVNVYVDTRYIDCFSVGDFVNDEASLSDVLDGIREYRKEQ